MAEPLNLIRQNNRNYIKLKRQFHRDESNDLNRSLKDFNGKEHVTEIVNKLKTKSGISSQQLIILRNALMEDESNIELVLNVHGALRGLVRELTGHNVKKQCAAVGCLCNIALGDVKACNTIAKAAGMYLVTAIDNAATELAVTSPFALGNLAASNMKVCNMLISQGALVKLSAQHNIEELQNACLYALLHFAHTLGDHLSVEYLQMIIQTVSQLKITPESTRLLFILSCHENFIQCLTEQLIMNLIEQLHRQMESFKVTDTSDEVVYLLRTLANTNTDVYNLILRYLVNNDLSVLCNKVLSTSSKNRILVESFMWLLGNMYNNCDDKTFFYRIVDVQ